MDKRRKLILNAITTYFEKNKTVILNYYFERFPQSATSSLINALEEGKGYTESHIEMMIHMIGVYSSMSEVMEAYNKPILHMPQVDVIDMFSGCGGVSVGFQIINQVMPIYRIIGAIDIDTHANSTYEKNIGLKPVQLDIKELANNEEQYFDFINSTGRNELNPLVLIGCAPCQGFSSHRKKDKDKVDERNTLVEEFASVAAKLKPDVILMENVPELLSKKYWKNYDAFRAVLSKEGYFIRAGIYNMAEFGVPQERFRAVVIAAKYPFTLPRGFLNASDFVTVGQAIGNLSPLKPGIPDVEDSMHVTVKHHQSTIDTILKVPKDGGNRPFGVGPKCLDKVKGFSDVYGRLYWNRPSITITAYCRNPASGRFIHPEQNRGLSIREAAILQGFPKNFVFEGPVDDKYRQIGNAVPPKFSAYMASYLVATLLGLKKENKEDSLDITTPVSNSYSSVIAGMKLSRRASSNG